MNEIKEPEDGFMEGGTESCQRFMTVPCQLITGGLTYDTADLAALKKNNKRLFEEQAEMVSP